MLKKYIIVVAFLGLSVLLCSCSFAGNVVDTAIDVVKDAIGPSERELAEEMNNKAEELYNQVIQIVQKKGSSQLYELFCMRNQTKDTLDEIDDFFTLVTGTVYTSSIEHDRVLMPEHFYRSPENYALSRIMAENIETSDKKTYSMSIVMCVNATEYEDCVGIQSISLYDGENKICEIGNVIEHEPLCEISNKWTEIDKETIFSADIQNAYVTDVLYYLNQQDKDGFVSLFNDEMKPLAEQNFENIMELIDGKLETYSCLDRPACGGTTQDGYHIELHGDATIYDILTENGKLYEIGVGGDFINKNEPEREGLSYFYIQLEENQLNEQLEHEVISEIEIR